jgi:hypothetical protein
VQLDERLECLSGLTRASFIILLLAIGGPGPGMPFRITSRAGLLPPGPCQTPEMHIEPWMNHGPAMVPVKSNPRQCPPPIYYIQLAICGPGPGMPFRITSRAGLLPPGPCQTPEMHIEPWMNHGPDEPW